MPIEKKPTTCSQSFGGCQVCGTQGTQKRKLLPVEYGTVYLERLTIETSGGNSKMLTGRTFVGAVQK